MMTTFSLSQTLAFFPKCSLNTPIVPGPQISCVIKTSTSIQTFSPGWTSFFLDFAAKIFSVKVIDILFHHLEKLHNLDYTDCPPKADPPQAEKTDYTD